MRRLAVLLGAMVALGGLANLAMAGDYHVGKLLVCSDCHIAHGSQQHGYTPASSAADADTAWLGLHTTDPPYPYLLRGETINNACLNCHDGKNSAPDVLLSNTGSTVRSAGALNVPNTGAHGYANTGVYSEGTGHTLWSTDPPPGITGPSIIGTEGLECTDCHGAHGNKFFRNLQGKTSTTQTYIDDAWLNKAVTYEIGSAPSSGTSTAVVLEGTAHNYSVDNVNYLEPNSATSPYGEWCMACHTQFHGGPTGAFSANVLAAGSPLPPDEIFKRHPTAGVDVTVGTTTASWNNAAGHRLKLMDAAAKWDYTSTTMTPSCFTCHKSHGNGNKFGLIFVIPNGDGTAPTAGFPSGASIDPRLTANVRGAMTEEGDGGEYRDLCRNCHGMGRWPTGNPTNIQ